MSLAGSDIRRPGDGSSEVPSSEYDRVKNGYVGVAGPADDEMVGDCFELPLRLRLRWEPGVRVLESEDEEAREDCEAASSSAE